MADEHGFINRLVKRQRTRKVPGWGRIMTNIDKVTGRPCPESEDSLLRVLGSTVEIRLPSGSDHPHMLSPLESLQAEAIQGLAAYGPKHRAVIKAFAEKTESETLELIARSCLKRLEGSTRR